MDAANASLGDLRTWTHHVLRYEHTTPDIAPQFNYHNSWGFNEGGGTSTYCERETFPFSQTFMSGKGGAIYHRDLTMRPSDTAKKKNVQTSTSIDYHYIILKKSRKTTARDFKGDNRRSGRESHRETPNHNFHQFVLTFWRRTFFFQILAHPVFKMWVIQKPNKVALWNKRHFEGKKTEIIRHV